MTTDEDHQAFERTRAEAPLMRWRSPSMFRASICRSKAYSSDCWKTRRADSQDGRLAPSPPPGRRGGRPQRSSCPPPRGNLRLARLHGEDATAVAASRAQALAIYVEHRGLLVQGYADRLQSWFPLLDPAADPARSHGSACARQVIRDSYVGVTENHARRN